MKFVFLHGMGGSPADWTAVNAILPGNALTVPPRENIAEVVSALAAQIQSPHDTTLCGYSMGGRLAILMADQLLREGKIVGGLALLGAGMGFSDDQERRSRLLVDERWARLAESSAPKFWDEWYRQSLFGSFMDLPEARQAEWLKSRISMDIKALTTQLRRLGPAGHENLEPVLRRLRQASISVLYLAGELDKKYLNLGQKLAKEMGLALAVIPEAGHILPLEAPREVAERLKEFFSSAK